MLNQHQALGHHLAIHPKQIAQLAIFQLDTLNLEQRIGYELEDNPFLDENDHEIAMWVHTGVKGNRKAMKYMVNSITIAMYKLLPLTPLSMIILIINKRASVLPEAPVVSFFPTLELPRSGTRV